MTPGPARYVKLPGGAPGSPPRAPYVLRVSDTGLSGLWSQSRRPAVADWLEQVRKGATPLAGTLSA